MYSRGKNSIELSFYVLCQDYLQGKFQGMSGKVL